MTQALIVRNDSALSVNFTDQAIALRESVLDKSAAIARVTDADEQRIAVESQAEIATLLRDAEKARVSCKEPVLEFGRNIDLRAKEFVADLNLERDRLDKLVGDFQVLEDARVKAAEAERRLEQQRIEEARMKAEREARDKAELEQRKLNAEMADARRLAAAAKNAVDAEKARVLQMEIERERKVSQAKSLEQMETIRANSQEEIAALPVATAARVKGQRVDEEWKITVTDVWALARAHPMCVNIEPRLTDIKMILNSGRSVAGVIAKREIKASVRAGTGRAAIEV